MKHIPADKYNIAWFKLAEFVTRKEKERALGIYRLLSHSIQNNALSIQLEGDILLAFQDPRALECYQKAAQLYQDNNQLSQAAALLEHVAYISENYTHYAPILIDLYTSLGNQPKIIYYAGLYIEELLKADQVKQAESYLKLIIKKLDKEHTAQLYQTLTLVYCKNAPDSGEKIKFFIQQVLENSVANSYQVHRFLTQLQHASPDYYQFALTCLTV